MSRSLTLCYHAVSDTWEHPLATRTEVLLRQLAGLIKRGWTPVGAGETVARSRVLHLTFDDGFRSVLSVVAPLEQLGIRPTIFVCTDFASDGRALDVAPLNRTADAHRHELATLRWDELRDLAMRGIEIGSHSCTHPNLVLLSDDELRREVVTSREAIESELGRRCRYFAYPFGQFDRRVQRVVERAGYHAAFGLVGVGRPGGSFGIARVEPTRFEGSLGTALKGTRWWLLLARPLRRTSGSLARLSRSRSR